MGGETGWEGRRLRVGSVRLRQGRPEEGCVDGGDTRADNSTRRDVTTRKEGDPESRHPDPSWEGPSERPTFRVVRGQDSFEALEEHPDWVLWTGHYRPDTVDQVIWTGKYGSDTTDWTLRTGYCGQVQWTAYCRPNTIDRKLWTR